MVLYFVEVHQLGPAGPVRDLLTGRGSSKSTCALVLGLGRRHRWPWAENEVLELTIREARVELVYHIPFQFRPTPR